MGGGGTISDSILGGTRHFFLLTLYNFKNIGGKGTCSPAPYSAVPEPLTSVTEVCAVIVYFKTTRVRLFI